mmetsp:Transcript_29042/g.85145  ORF Transcript_29042/g.85145 Transcript_29042/m.85145 type:complete len:241 (-) Transcript_29042:13-735(-)
MSRSRCRYMLRYDQTERASALEELLDGPLAGDQLLREHPAHSEHGEAAVLDLLELHGLVVRVGLAKLALEAKRIETVVARRVVGLVHVLRANALGDGNADSDLRPRRSGHLRLRLERPRAHGAVYVARQVEKLGHDETRGSEHGHPTVRDLGFAYVVEVAAELGEGGAEAERVKAHITRHGTVQGRGRLHEGNALRHLRHHRAAARRRAVHHGAGEAEGRDDNLGDHGRRMDRLGWRRFQ